MENIEIRESRPDDLAAIEALYPDAFPDEDLLPLVKDLLQETPPVLSLVSTIDAVLVGHVIFTWCHVGSDTDTQHALRAPLAVATARQRRGIGRALVAAGLQSLERSGVEQVYVLGDPAYYARLGFAAESDVMPPYPLPDAYAGAWQSIALGDRTPRSHGTLVVSPTWQQPALWGP